MNKECPKSGIAVTCHASNRTCMFKWHAINEGTQHHTGELKAASSSNSPSKTCFAQQALGRATAASAVQTYQNKSCASFATKMALQGTARIAQECGCCCCQRGSKAVQAKQEKLASSVAIKMALSMRPGMQEGSVLHHCRPESNWYEYVARTAITALLLPRGMLPSAEREGGEGYDGAQDARRAVLGFPLWSSLTCNGRHPPGGGGTRRLQWTD
jgi:hypothetical protein